MADAEYTTEEVEYPVVVYMQYNKLPIPLDPVFSEQALRYWHDRLMATSAKQLRNVLNTIIEDADKRHSSEYKATPAQLEAIATSLCELIWAQLGLMAGLGLSFETYWNRLAENKLKGLNNEE